MAAMVYGAIWAILPEKLEAILDALAFLRAGGHYSSEEVRQQIGAVDRPERRRSGSIAVLPLWGTIAHRANMLTQSSGGTSVEQFSQQLRAALDDPGTSAIVLDVDSPGGAVSGVPELADEIFRARGRKPIVAVANNLAASAAYWLASQADEVVVTPSGQVGSIGVVAAHQDISRAQEMAGIKTTLIVAGKHKAEASPYAPLGDEARAAIQEQVDAYYQSFVDAVARGRGVSSEVVRGGYGEGRLLTAQRAKAEGMVDRVATLDETIERLAMNRWRRPRVGASAEETVEAGEPMGVMVAVSAEEPPASAGPLPAHEAETSDGPWDGPANEARVRSGETEAYYRRIYAWRDPEGDPGVKATYRFIHHEVSEGGEPGPANLTACSTGIAVLNGARGGTTIPAADRPGVHRHLARHIEDAGREAPPLRGEAEGLVGMDVDRRRVIRLVLS